MLTGVRVDFWLVVVVCHLCVPIAKIHELILLSTLGFFWFLLVYSLNSCSWKYELVLTYSKDIFCLFYVSLLMYVCFDLPLVKLN